MSVPVPVSLPVTGNFCIKEAPMSLLSYCFRPGSVREKQASWCFARFNPNSKTLFRFFFHRNCEIYPIILLGLVVIFGELIMLSSYNGAKYYQHPAVSNAVYTDESAVLAAQFWFFDINFSKIFTVNKLRTSMYSRCTERNRGAQQKWNGRISIHINLLF